MQKLSHAQKGSTAHLRGLKVKYQNVILICKSNIPMIPQYLSTISKECFDDKTFICKEQINESTLIS